MIRQMFKLMWNRKRRNLLLSIEMLVSFLVVFAITALGWMFRRNIVIGSITIPGWSNLLSVQDLVHDSTVAIFASLLLFAIPVVLKEGEFLLDWKSAVKIPWGILLLFGGGLALANQFEVTGLARWVGENLNFLSVVPLIVAVIVVVFTVDFLTEVTSNMAITSIFMPILAAMAVGMGTHPLLLMVAGTIAASLAFMLPVATPPNAVVFSSGYLTLPQMARTGFIMNLIGMIITTLVLYALAVPILRITLNRLPDWVH